MIFGEQKSTTELMPPKVASAAPDINRPITVVHADISDVLFYLTHHNHVSGIQRVLIEIINAARINAFSWGMEVRWCAVHDITSELMRIDNEALYILVDEVNGVNPARERIDESIKFIKTVWTSDDIRAEDIYIPLGAFWVSNGTSNMLAAMQRIGVKTGVLIYDLIPITHPEYCEVSLSQIFTRQMSEILVFIDFAFTISNHVKSELEDYLRQLNLSPIPVVSLPLGHSPVASGRDNSASPRILRVAQQPYVLSVGTIEVRKNHTYLLSVWRRMLRERGPENTPFLILIGRIGWRVADLMAQLEASNNLNGHVIILSNASDGELNWLYRNCLFTVFPSFVEGWGLPVGESLANGKLAVASNTSSIPEVGGDLALYFDPFNVNDGYDKIVHLLDDTEMLSKKTLAISNEFRSRSWTEVAEMLFSTTVLLGKAKRENSVAGYAELPEASWLEFGEASNSGRTKGKRTASLACTEGWHNPEAWGRWASSTSAMIAFKARPLQKYSIILEYHMPPWMNNARIEIQTNSSRFSVRNTDEAYTRGASGRSAVVAFETTSDSRGIVSFKLDTIGDAVHGEIRMLYVGVDRIMYYAYDDLMVRGRALEQIVFSQAGVLQGEII